MPRKGTSLEPYTVPEWCCEHCVNGNVDTAYVHSLVNHRASTAHYVRLPDCCGIHN